MTRKNYIFVLLSVGLSIFFVRGQQTANYVNNGSFEKLKFCQFPWGTNPLYYWSGIDTTTAPYAIQQVCAGNVPGPWMDFQYPRTGNGFVGGTFLCIGCNTLTGRSYLRNKLKGNLVANKVYCIKFYVNLRNSSPYASDAIGAYLSDNSLDTVNYGQVIITYLSPQIQNPTNNFITDTLNWTKVMGTYTATGIETNLVIGNFKNDANTNVVVTNTNSSGTWVDYYIDDVSCIDIDLPAYAGPDAFCIPGNSVYIGRQLDAGIDEACTWYKLPNMTTAIDTAAGIWVTPITPTSTYVVIQDICGNIKYDTVIVYQSGVGLSDLQMYSDNINLSPNPTADNLNIYFTPGISQISITNSLGQIVRQQDLDPKNIQIILQTSDLSNGLYQIHFKTSFGTVTKKFVKTN